MPDITPGPDHSQMKLGKLAARPNPRKMAIAAALFPKLPPPPDAVDWTHGHTDWGMMANDRIGDCVFAGAGHLIQVVTDQTDNMVTLADQAIVTMYEQWAGYDPANPATDQGYVEQDFIEKWEVQGFCGYKMFGHAETVPTNLDHVRKGIAFFGPAYVGAVLPASAQTQDIWDVVRDDGGVWGGHCMIAISYDTEFVTFVTWGGLKRATWDWWNNYVDECHSLLVEPWIKRYPAASVEMLIEILNAVK